MKAVGHQSVVGQMDGYNGDVGCTRSVVGCCARTSDKFKGKKREEKSCPIHKVWGPFSERWEPALSCKQWPLNGCTFQDNTHIKPPAAASTQIVMSSKSACIVRGRSGFGCVFAMCHARWYASPVMPLDCLSFPHKILLNDRLIYVLYSCSHTLDMCVIAST